MKERASEENRKGSRGEGSSVCRIQTKVHTDKERGVGREQVHKDEGGGVRRDQ